MAKAKANKGAAGGAQRHIRVRLEYLHKAAAYIQSASNLKPDQVAKTSDQLSDDSMQQTTRTVLEKVNSSKELEEQRRSPPQQNAIKTRPSCLPRQYISQMRGASLKSQLRLPIEVKRSFCKRCDILLVPGVNCIEKVENASRGGRKPWADVFVVRCTACGTEKRFPRSEKRSRKLSERREQPDPKDGPSTVS